MTVALVLIGGAVGALTRYWAERWSVHRFGERVPWGTALVNLAGALLLGALVALHARDALSDQALVFLGTGFCGALTTFSGFMGQVESRLRHNETRAVALQYLVGVTLFGLLLAGVALRLGR